MKSIPSLQILKITINFKQYSILEYVILSLTALSNQYFQCFNTSKQICKKWISLKIPILLQSSNIFLNAKTFNAIKFKFVTQGSSKCLLDTNCNSYTFINK